MNALEDEKCAWFSSEPELFNAKVSYISHATNEFVSTKKSYNEDCRCQGISLLSRTLRAETSLFDADVSSLSLATRESSVVLKITISACVFQAVGLSSLAELKEKNPQFLDLWLRYYAKYSQQVNKKKKKELEAKLLIRFNTFGKVSNF